jgi:hypothetical protein
MGNSNPQSAVSEQTLPVPIRVGDRITLYQHTESDTGSYTVDPFFDDTVTQFVPDTGLLRFEDASIGRARLKEKMLAADGVEIRTSVDR